MEPYDHGGNIQKLNRERNLPDKEWIDFSANINPLGLPDDIKYSLLQSLEDVSDYPDPQSRDFTDSICAKYNVRSENVLVSNGASELFFNFVRVIEKPKVLIVTPSYSDYQRAAEVERRDIAYFELNEQENFTLDCKKLAYRLTGNEIVILGRPNNPTGTLVPKKDLIQIIQSYPETVFIVDEAFIDFVNFPRPDDSENLNDESLSSVILHNLIVILSLTKMYSVAGLRIGLAIGSAEYIQKARKIQSSWPLNTFAQRAGSLIMKDQTHETQTRKYIDEQRKFLLAEFQHISQINVYPSPANFILFKISEGDPHPEKLYEHFLENGIIIRTCDNFRGLNSSYYRMAILTPDQNRYFIEVLKNYFQTKRSIKPKIKKTPALMILGTGSNVGKSLLTTAFCRIFLNEGLRVYPFKSQNMSLNSCVTRDGYEISRAQYLQAQAARVEPDVRMNPVLMKPVSKLKSQIILSGKPIGNQGYLEYRANKTLIWQTVRESYDGLSAEADLMILEGAGSPVEMNLKKYDIVNMRMADYADAKVLLAGNIDFGGIYASLAGTLMLLDKKERRRVAGLIVNQFRGDESLFKEGRTLLEKITGKPVLGVIPFVDKHLLPDEDSLAFSARSVPQNSHLDIQKEHGNLLSIFVIRLPHMSNFTDFDPFFQQDNIRLTFIDAPPTTSNIPDALIIPGSKNVISDMNWLNETGLSQYVGSLRTNTAAEVIGLCGGFQMLGKFIKDPHSIESDHGQIAGLGLLDLTTELAFDKTLSRFSGKHIASGVIVSGYEIHHGITEGRETLLLESATAAGFSSNDRQVWGTYIHGLFDNDDFRLWFFNRLLTKKNQTPLDHILPYNIDSAIEKFAETVKNNLDMDKIRKIIFG